MKVLPKKKLSNTITIHTDDKKLVKNLFDKISSSSSEVSGAVYIPEEPKDENYDQNKEMVFKFNDLKYKGSFLALRIEGDKISIDEKLKALTNELELSKLNTTVLDVHQSTPFWKKINNLEIFKSTKNNLLRVVVPPSKGPKLMQFFVEDGDGDDVTGLNLVQLTLQQLVQTILVLRQSARACTQLLTPLAKDEPPHSMAQ